MVGFASSTVSAPSVHFSHPPRSFFKFPPDDLPRTLVPPVSDYSLARPFNVSPELYNALLDVKIPLTIAAVYATLVYLLNGYNRQRKHRPWAVSKTRPFLALVVAHNVLLALFSAWTFAGMLHAVRHTWPGVSAGLGGASVVDAFCKLNGPRGFGAAATYDPSTGSWGFKDRTLKLLNGSPDSTDVGRLWNEGLAFYGWLFYLSKFYEVVDTFIILAKGKHSSLLQTYHHAGAMICVWAGIRYMSPPIWMFVLFNSGIHALMYSYYALTALSIRTPNIIKRTLTTMQIAQFVVGASYAFAHLFVAYNVPVSTPYLFRNRVTETITATTSAIASATASAGLSNWLKKIVLRAAGEEGLAENVRDNYGEPFGLDARKIHALERIRDETRYRTEFPTIHCIDTSGQVFAILLNCLYLAPLAYLFVRFFIRSYTHRTKVEADDSPYPKRLLRSSSDAAKSVQREIRQAMSDSQGYNNGDDSAIDGSETEGSEDDEQQNNGYTLQDGLSSLGEKAVQKGKVAKDAAGDAVYNASAKARELALIAEKKIEEAIDATRAKEPEAEAKIKEAFDAVKQKVTEAASAARNKTGDLIDAAKQKSDDVEQVAESKARGAQSKVKKAQSKAKKAQSKAKEGADADEQNSSAAESSAQDGTKSGATTVQEKGLSYASILKENLQDTVDEAKDNSPDAAGKVKEAAYEAGQRARDAVSAGKAKAEQMMDAAQDEAHDASSETEAKADDDTRDAGDASYIKVDGEKTADGTSDDRPATNGRSAKSEEEAQALEVSIDEAMDSEEEKAQAEMQP